MVAFDLGSNTLRAVKIDCETKEREKEYEKIVKTADGLQKSGEISKESINRVIEAIKEAKKALEIDKDEKIEAVATAALRIATNREKVLNRIKKETGIEFEVISGTEEANYTAFAVSEALKKIGVCSDDFILLDLGGASSELYIKKRERSFIKSFDIGIVTLTQKYNSTKEVQEAIDNETREVRRFVDEIYKKFSKPKLFVSTAGTATTLAAFLQGMDYESYEHVKINGYKIREDQIKSALDRLLKMSEEERSRWVGVGRGDLIFSGIIILTHILKIADFDQMTVIDDGLREGVALQACKEQVSSYSI